MKNWDLKTFILIIAGILGCGLGLTPCQAKDRAKIVIKMATLAPKGSTLVDLMEELNHKIKVATHNEVEFKLYSGGVQGDEKEVFRKIRLGQLHGGAFTGHGLGEIVPAVRVLELPYVFLNSDEVSYVRSKMEARMNEKFEQAGYVVLGWGEVGFVHNFSVVPITSIEVARKLKWWNWEDDPLGRAVFKAWGITPVSLSLTDVLTSLSTNLIDTAPATPYGAVAFRWYTRFKYMSEVPTTNGLAATIIKKSKWDRISPSSKELIQNISRSYFQKMIDTTRHANSQAVATLKKAGIVIVTASDTGEQMEATLSAAKAARQALVGELYSQELLDQTLSYVDEYREQHPGSTYQRYQ